MLSAVKDRNMDHREHKRLKCHAKITFSFKSMFFKFLEVIFLNSLNIRILLTFKMNVCSVLVSITSKTYAKDTSNNFNKI